MERTIAGEVEAYQAAWAAARGAAAAATAAWAEQTGDELARAIAVGAAADFGAEGLDPSFDRVAELLLAGRAADDLGASAEHRLLRETLRDFTGQRITPFAQQIHRGDQDVPEDIISGVAELGLFGLSIPETYGGSLGDRPDHIAMLIGTEELSAGSLAAGGSLMTRPEILVRALLSGGSEAQKRRWLPGIASGERLVAVAVTEPDFGSDVAALQCRVVRKPDAGWSVNGAKLWCTFAGRAHLVMLLCRSGPEPGHRGLSLFVLEKPTYLGHDFEHRQPHGGMLRGRAIPTLGYRGLHTFELVFEDYRLPDEALLGEEGRGFYLQMKGFATGRLQTAARAVGVMQAAVRDTLAYTAQRKVFGKPVAEHELAGRMIGRMAVRLHASRRLSYAAAALHDEGGGQVEASLAKLYASRMAEYVTRDAMQLFGGMGYGEETDVSRYFVDARVLAIFEGAEEVLALRVIGKAVQKVGGK
ncbi:MAG: acyl-CoA dehydrogenase family protein [Candidatus Dormibacteraeota bacterium]|nr:acyl-CoA dehydrogenase family protein [Candidatus Dormibacteraeota bacterium]